MNAYGNLLEESHSLEGKFLIHLGKCVHFLDQGHTKEEIKFRKVGLKEIRKETLFFWGFFPLATDSNGVDVCDYHLVGSKMSSVTRPETVRRKPLTEDA